MAATDPSSSEPSARRVLIAVTRRCGTVPTGSRLDIVHSALIELVVHRSRYNRPFRPEDRGRWTDNARHAPCSHYFWLRPYLSDLGPGALSFQPGAWLTRHGPSTVWRKALPRVPSAVVCPHPHARETAIAVKSSGLLERLHTHW